MFLTALADSTQSWTTLGYSPLFLPHNLHPTHCIELYDIYRENGLEPDLDSYTALLAMYGEAGDMESIMKVSSLDQFAYMYTINWEPCQANHAAWSLLYQHHNSLDLSVTAQKESYCNKMANMKMSLVHTCKITE